MLKDGQPSDREERSLSAATVIARWQGNGEPCKSRGLRTVLWTAGGEIPPADPAAWNPDLAPRTMAQSGSRRVRHPGMDILVQPPAFARTDWQHSSCRGRSTLLCSN